MKKLTILTVLSLIVLSGCSDDEPSDNDSDLYAICDSQLSACAGSQPGRYCLFGFKWGGDQAFDLTGINGIGPQTSGGTITYSFQEANGVINTHLQTNVPSVSWSEIFECAQAEIKAAIEDWEQVADISFQELPENSESDIQFYVAPITQSAVAYPNYQESPCNLLSGDVIFDSNSTLTSCKGYYLFALHEIGHALGLGHVSTSNIMAADESKFFLDGLQSGDIAGIRQIYGEK